MILVLHGLDNARGMDAAASLGLTQATLGRAETNNRGKPKWPAAAEKKIVREWLLKLSEDNIQELDKNGFLSKGKG